MGAQKVRMEQDQGGWKVLVGSHVYAKKLVQSVACSIVENARKQVKQGMTYYPHLDSGSSSGWVGGVK